MYKGPMDKAKVGVGLRVGLGGGGSRGGKMETAVFEH